MLTHPSSSILTPQDLSPSSLRSFPRTFFLSPLVFKPSKSVNLTYQSRSYFSLAAAAVTAETVDEDEKDGVDDDDDVAETVTVVATKPKKGKAALLLKSDRVIFFEFYSFLVFLDGFLLNFINYNWGSGFVDY